MNSARIFTGPSVERHSPWPTLVVRNIELDKGPSGPAYDERCHWLLIRTCIRVLWISLLVAEFSMKAVVVDVREVRRVLVAVYISVICAGVNDWSDAGLKAEGGHDLPQLHVGALERVWKRCRALMPMGVGMPAEVPQLAT